MLQNARGDSPEQTRSIALMAAPALCCAATRCRVHGGVAINAAVALLRRHALDRINHLAGMRAQDGVWRCSGGGLLAHEVKAGPGIAGNRRQRAHDRGTRVVRSHFVFERVRVREIGDEASSMVPPA